MSADACSSKLSDCLRNCTDQQRKGTWTQLTQLLLWRHGLHSSCSHAHNRLHHAATHVTVWSHIADIGSFDKRSPNMKASCHAEAKQQRCSDFRNHLDKHPRCLRRRCLYQRAD